MDYLYMLNRYRHTTFEPGEIEAEKAKKELEKSAQLSAEELRAEIKRLEVEMGVTEQEIADGVPEEVGERLLKFKEKIAELNESPVKYLESVDNKRVDVGLIIARPPIYLAHREEEK